MYIVKAIRKKTGNTIYFQVPGTEGINGKWSQFRSRASVFNTEKDAKRMATYHCRHRFIPFEVVKI